MERRDAGSRARAARAQRQVESAPPETRQSTSPPGSISPWRRMWASIRASTSTTGSLQSPARRGEPPLEQSRRRVELAGRERIRRRVLGRAARAAAGSMPVARRRARRRPAASGRRRGSSPPAGRAASGRPARTGRRSRRLSPPAPGAADDERARAPTPGTPRAACPRTARSSGSFSSGSTSRGTSRPRERLVGRRAARARTRSSRRGRSARRAAPSPSAPRLLDPGRGQPARNRDVAVHEPRARCTRSRRAAPGSPAPRLRRAASGSGRRGASRSTRRGRSPARSRCGRTGSRYGVAASSSRQRSRIPREP